MGQYWDIPPMLFLGRSRLLGCHRILRRKSTNTDGREEYIFHVGQKIGTGNGNRLALPLLQEKGGERLTDIIRCSGTDQKHNRVFFRKLGQFRRFEEMPRFHYGAVEN